MQNNYEDFRSLVHKKLATFQTLSLCDENILESYLVDNFSLLDLFNDDLKYSIDNNKIFFIIPPSLLIFSI